MDLRELSWLATLVLSQVGRTLNIQKAYVNSFPKNNKMRHDVLLKVEDTQLSQLRDTLRNLYPVKSKSFNMQPLHVSYHVNYESLEAATKDAERLNELLKEPYPVIITGVTLD